MQTRQSRALGKPRPKPSAKGKSRREQPPPTKTILVSGAVGGLAGLALLFLVSLPVAFAVLKTGNANGLLFPASLAVAAIAGYAGGLLSALRAKRANPFLGGLAAGGVLLLCLLIGSLLFPGATGSGIRRIAPAAVALVASALAGMTVSARK